MSNQFKLSLINESNENNNPDILIFTYEPDGPGDPYADAWQVIQNLGSGSSHPFTYTVFPVQVAYEDRFGNTTRPVDANKGESFIARRNDTGDVMVKSEDKPADMDEIVIYNELTDSHINGLIYRDGYVANEVKEVEPEESANFKFADQPSIWLTVASRTETDNSTMLRIQDPTEIKLEGFKEADIVMGSGEGGLITFKLSNQRDY